MLVNTEHQNESLKLIGPGQLKSMLLPVNFWTVLPEGVCVDRNCGGLAPRVPSVKEIVGMCPAIEV